MKFLIAAILAFACSAASAGEWRDGNAIYVNGRFVGVSVGHDFYRPSQVIWGQPPCSAWSPPRYQTWPVPRYQTWPVPRYQTWPVPRYNTWPVQ